MMSSWLTCHINIIIFPNSLKNATRIYLGAAVNLGEIRGRYLTGQGCQILEESENGEQADYFKAKESVLYPKILRSNLRQIRECPD
jgi:hypothetical protein